MEDKQANLILSILVLLSLASISTGVRSGMARSQTNPRHGDCRHHHHHYRKRGSIKLFIFGDSFVDTGNFPKNKGSWLTPYGITFPGKPSGRFSDGRVLTDYVASFLGISTPFAYNEWLKLANGKQEAGHGMNFALGGSGVLNTEVKEAMNMSTQINNLKQLIEDKVYTKCDLHASVALVSIAGNDYANHLKNTGTIKGIRPLISRVIEELGKNLKLIHELGVRKVAVDSMAPNGCLPEATFPYSFRKCDERLNSLARFHNKLLREKVRKLNEETKTKTFLMLDLYAAFMSAMKRYRHTKGYIGYGHVLRPCRVKAKNAPSSCKHPEKSFYWDWVHPSQNGWRLVYLALRPSLYGLYH